MDPEKPTPPQNSKMFSNIAETTAPAAIEEPSLRPVALDFDRTDAVFFSALHPPAAVDLTEGFEEFYSRRSRDSERRRRMAMPYVGAALGLLVIVIGAGIARQRTTAAESLLASDRAASAMPAMPAIAIPASASETMNNSAPSDMANGSVPVTEPGAAPAADAKTVLTHAAAAPVLAQPSQLALGIPDGSQTAETKPAVQAIDAKSERRNARLALERGRIKVALAHAQSATEADETDAEGWLLLGAALQADSNYKAAREAFVQCTKMAKRGPKSECAALLR